MFLDDIVGRMSVEEARMSGADKWRQHFDRETAPARAEFNKSTEHYNRLKTDPAYKEQQFKAWQEKIHGKKDVAEGEHDAEFIGHEDSFYHMADFAHKQMKKGQSLQDVIQYLRDNNYLEPQEVNSFVKQVRGEKWNESVAENYEDDAEGESEIQNGSYVTDTQDSTGEVYLVSQYEPGARRCWIGDQDGRGWYISPDRLEMCDDPRKINQYFGKKEYDEDSWSSEKSVGTGDAWSGQSHEMVEAGRMSAAVKLQRAWEREQSKSTASRERADQAKAAFEREWQAKQQKEKQGVAEDEGDAEGLPHLTRELLTHIVQQVGKEGAHAIVKSLEWGDGAARELLHLIVTDLKNNIEPNLDEHIGKVKGGFRLYSHKGKNLGTFPSKGGAEKHEREVQYFKHADESADQLNELDLLAPRSTYFKMGDGAWIKADYRGTQGLTGHTSNDATAFSSFEWVPPQTASSLGLEKKLTEPSTSGQSDPNQLVPDTNIQGNGPMGTRSSNVVDFTTAKSDAIPASLKSKLVNWVHANPQQGVTEQLSDASPITGAVTRRILSQRLDLLKQYGPELVGAAIDNVADYVGDVDKIGSRDVSAWVAQVERMLQDNPPEAFGEGVAEDAHSPEFFKQIVGNHEGDVRGIFKDLYRLGLHKNIQKFCEWVRGQGIADIYEGIALAKQVGLETDDEQELAYEGYLQAKELLGQGLAETSESDRIQALWDRYERAEELYGKNDPRTKALADQIRGERDEFRVIGKQGMAEGVAETVPMSDAVKVLRQYGADKFKTTSNELHFYKQGRPFSVDLVLNKDATRSVTLSSLNSATRGLKGQGVAEGAKTKTFYAPDGKTVTYDPSKEHTSAPVNKKVGPIKKTTVSGKSKTFYAPDGKTVTYDPNKGVAEGVVDPQRKKAGKIINRCFGKISEYEDDGWEYLDSNAPVWNNLFNDDQYDGDIDAIIANAPIDLLVKSAKELMDVVSDLPYELDEQGVAEVDPNAPYTPSPAKPFRNPPGFNKQGTGVGNKLAQQNRAELNQWRMGISMAGEKEPTQSKGTPVPANAFAQGVLKDLKKVNVKDQGVAEALGTSPDKLLARTGMNNAHKFPRKGQTDLGNIPAMNTPGNSPETDAYADQRRAERPGDLKAAIRGQLGKHHKPNLPEQGVEEGVYGRNKGYTQGFASPNAPSLGGNNYDSDGNQLGGGHDEYHVPDPVDTATWFIRINGKLLKDRDGSPYHFRGREAANKAALTMMKKPFNAGKKFTLTTSHSDDQSLSESYWAKLQNERSTKLNNLVNELKENIK